MSTSAYRLPLRNMSSRKRIVYEGRWISISESEYNKRGCDTVQIYESVHRKKRSSDINVDAVYMIATLFNGGREYFILIKQYRIPIGQFCLEFPHGMVDEGESSAAVTAVRELLEETGLSANKVLSCSEGRQLLCPSLSDISVQFVRAEVNENDFESAIKKRKLDEGEIIEVVLVECGSLMEFIKEASTTMNVEAVLYSFAVGYTMNH